MLFKKYRGNRKVLMWLHKRHKGKCCYCGCKTVLPEIGSNTTPPDNMATIEHIYGSQNIIRLLLPTFSKIKLACLKCNRERANTEYKKLLEGYDYRETHDSLLIGMLEKNLNN